MKVTDAVTMFHGLVGAPGAQTLYTVPVGLTVVVRHILVANTTGSPTTLQLSLDGKVVFPTEQIAANKRAEQWLMRRLAGGLSIQATAAVNNALSVLVEGFSYS